MSQKCSLAIKDGFSGRVWLSYAEWSTYRRRAPVRYLSRLRTKLIQRDGPSCSVCGLSRPTKIQIAHRVPFKIGVVDWGLTPDWLDGEDNLALAHAGKCNDQIEIVAGDIGRYLESLGIDIAKSPAIGVTT